MNTFAVDNIKKVQRALPTAFANIKSGRVPFYNLHVTTNNNSLDGNYTIMPTKLAAKLYKNQK